MIYILTGSIRSGKTTALMDWVNTRNDADGLLCPDGENGQRYFLKIKSKVEFEFEAEIEVEKEDLIEIGNFKFLKSAFDEANDYLILKASEAKAKYLIIDELGKLELMNLGLHLAAATLIPKYLNTENQHLILVIRDYLLEDILRNYSISEYSVFQKEDLYQLS